VDGNRDRPPGKTAENWGRRDGIRAGSVSGPWRSGPRQTDAWPMPAAEPEPAPLARRKRRRPLPVAFWVVLGCSVAGAFVAAAYMLRPDGPEIAATPAPRAEQAAPPPAPAPIVAEDVAPGAAEPVPVDPALAAVSSVRLRIPEALPAERRDAIVAALEEAEIADVQVEALPFAVNTTRVGYYLEADRGAAEALARLVRPLLDAGEAVPVRDYGKLLDDPEPGRLDLWVES
jgi:hypothetical protein